MERGILTEQIRCQVLRSTLKNSLEGRARNLKSDLLVKREGLFSEMKNIMTKFKVGDKIMKPKGYKFPGTIVSVFENTKGQTRLVAEMEDIGILHIFNEDQLEHDN